MMSSFRHDVRLYRAFGLIDRPRLLDKLRAVLDHKLTLISAPPGYGKTTVAAQFVRQVSCPVAWHTVEERERDIPNLWAQTLTALEPIAPDIQTLEMPHGYAPNELAALITDFLRKTVRTDFIYVLDDVQHLTGSTLTEIWLQTLVEFSPPQCHLILISRMLPDLPLAQMIARREVMAIGQHELRFTAQEIQALAGETRGEDLPEPTVQELTARLEGWPAGIVLALQPLPVDLERAMLSGGAGPEALFDALADLALRAQPDELRDFLLASSTLARVTPELCAVALGLSDGAHWLGEAQGRGLFLSRATGGLVYHRLFRSFLQRQLEGTDPGRFIDLHVRAAHWFEGQDDIDAAFDHYVAAGLADHAAALAERASQAYFALGKVETLLGWNAALGGTAVPGLLCVCAKIHTDRYEYAAAEVELDAAEQGFGTRGDDAGVLDVRLQRAMIDLQQSSYRQAVSRALPLVEAPGIPDDLRGRALNILGFAELSLGEVEAAVRHLELALPLYRSGGGAHALSQLLQNLEMAYTRAGRFGEAVACLQEVIALRRMLRSAGPLALALNNLGYYYHQHGNYREAMASFQEGLSIAMQAPERRVEGYLSWSTGDLQRDRGANDDALRLYTRAIALTGADNPALRAALLVSLSTLRRWQGNLTEAIRLAQEAQALAEAHDIALEGITARAALWAARFQAGRTAKARKQLELAAAALQERNIHVELMQVLGLCAQAALECGDTPAAEIHLSRALHITRVSESVHPAVMEMLHAPALEAFVLRSGTKYEPFARGLRQLREAQLRPTARHSHGKTALTYSLRLQTLGQEQIERDGEHVPSSAWRATTVREFFLYLLFGGRANREHLCSVFWPERSTSRVRSSFHTTLYRVRQALGDNVICFEEGLYGINPEVEVWCDALEFERLAAQARLLSPRDARTEDLWRRAVEFYRGDFLPSLDTEWLQPRRETLRETYIDALFGLGGCMRARGDFRAALLTFKRALSLEPYREDIHRAIMMCYADLGEKKRVKTHLRQLQDLLRQELATRPSPETVALVATLLN
jgi:LuxR family maltose regulon positive regulatory protein